MTFVLYILIGVILVYASTIFFACENVYISGLPITRDRFMEEFKTITKNVVNMNKDEFWMSIYLILFWPLILAVAILGFPVYYVVTRVPFKRLGNLLAKGLYLPAYLFSLCLKK